MKENQRIAVTKRMLKEGLLRLLEHKNLDKIRINELCAESGINRATFYRHYESPRDVLLELEMDFVSQIGPLTGQHKTGAEAQQALEHACTYIYEHADVAKILFRCNTDEDVMWGLNEFYRQFLELRNTELQLAQIDDATARAMVALLGGGCYCLLRQWILEDLPMTPAEIAALMCSVIHLPNWIDDSVEY